MFGLLSKAGGSRRAAGSRKGALTVLRNDGTVLEYRRRVRCSAVLASHPNHLVCPANALKQQGGMLAKDAFLELGRVYFLLPNPASFVEEACEADEPPVPIPFAPAQLVISKQQLTRLLSEATRAANANDQPQRKERPVRRSKSKQPWVASLESIPEYVAI